MKDDVPSLRKIWWLWLPLLMIPVQLVIEVTVPSKAYANLMSEGGPHEFVQFIFVLAAFCLAVRLLMKHRDMPLWMKIWVGIAALGCFYIGGEEISWGQHFIGWVTPDYWAAVNDQHETNLHNTSSWLDQKPRILLEIGVLVGGLIMPLIARCKGPDIFPEWLSLIAPHKSLAASASLLMVTKLEDHLSDLVGFTIIGRDSEVGELYIYYFILLYLIYLGRRLKRPA